MQAVYFNRKMAMLLVTLIVTFHKLNIKEISLSQRKNVFFLSLLFNTDVHLASSNAHFVIYSDHNLLVKI